MPERLLIGPGSPPSIDPVHPELSPPPEPCPKISGKSTFLYFFLLPRQESFASLHILTRRASEGSEALPSLARRVRMSFFGARVIHAPRAAQVRPRPRRAHAETSRAAVPALLAMRNRRLVPLGLRRAAPRGTVQKELDESGLSLGQGTHTVYSPPVPVAASPSSDPRRSAADTIPFIFGISRSWNWPRPTAWHRQSRPVPLADCTCG